MAATDQGALHGVRVVDFSWNLPGPACTWMLAGLGAQVTKVEPLRGEPARHLKPLFDWVNAGKEAVSFDPQDEASRAAVEALIAEADVVVEGFRPGKFAALGFDDARLAELNPRLVRCSISAYGQQGPRAQDPGHDLNAASLCGALALDGDGPPRPWPLPIADLSAAQLAAMRIVAALHAREQTGEGAVLDVAMVDALGPWVALWREGADLAALGERQAPPRARRFVRGALQRWLPRRLRSLPHYGVFRCADGAWLAVGIVDEDHFWRRLCDELHLGRYRGLPMGARALLGPVLRRRVARKLAREPRHHWLRVLGDLPVTAVVDGDGAYGALGDRLARHRPFHGSVALGPAPGRPGEAGGDDLSNQR